MIVEFSVKNFRSIKDIQTVSFLATGLKSPLDSNVDFKNIVTDGGVKLLRTIGVYGSNGSGKSNIIRAFEYFLDAIKKEASTESQLSNLCDPFIYQDNPTNTESFFQMVLILENKKYSYGFTVKKSNDPTKIEKGSTEVITGEWLIGPKEKNSKELFTREDDIIIKEGLPERDNIPDLPNSHTLFLTYATAFDSQGICGLVRGFLKARTISNFTSGFERFRRHFDFLEVQEKKTNVLEFLASFGLNYDDIIIESDPSKPKYPITPDRIFLERSFLCSNQIRKIKLNLIKNESAGTQRLFDISCLLLKAFTMPSGGIFILDEVDSHFHPALLKQLITHFNNPDINKSNLQLLFTSHDVNLMSPSIMRRDQFYFSEIQEDFSTRVFSLAELKGIRNDADFAKQYLAGIYGALPILRNYLTEQINEPQTVDDKAGY